MSQSTPLVLVVDDNADILEIVRTVLSENHYNVISAQCGQDAMELFWKQLPDLVIVDVRLPDMSGFELCRSLKNEPWFQSVPIVILSAANEIADKVQGFEAGAVDYITKPFQPRELSARIQAHLRNKFWNESLSSGDRLFHTRVREIENRFLALAENSNELIFELDSCRRYAYLGPNSHRIIGYEPSELLGSDCSEMLYPEDRPVFSARFQEALRVFKPCQIQFRMRHSDGQWRWMESTCVAFYTENHEPRVVCVARDVSERKKYEDHLGYLANHDALTQLHNRQFLIERLKTVLGNMDGRALHALLYIDMDNFKIVNDSHGHFVGDRILREFAARLKNVFGEQTVISRFGGDEFVILLEHTTREATLEKAEKLRKTMEGYHFHEARHTFELNVSIGIAFTDTVALSKEILARADDACYIAKLRGRNRIEIYSPDSSEINRLHHDNEWSALVKSSLKNKRFELWYQPIVETGSGAVERHEALIRLRTEDGRVILPGEFLSAAAHWGMMIKLDRHVIELGAQDLARHPWLKLSINLSADSLMDQNLPEFISGTFKRAGISPDRVIFEITETEVIANFTHAMGVIQQLRADGFLFALDDFGVGFSSMAYLKELPVERIKIDGIFIRNMQTDPYNRMLVGAINDIGHFLGRKTVAEFVENAEALQHLREIGVDYAQGNFFGSAKPISAITKDLPAPSGMRSRMHQARLP